MRRRLWPALFALPLFLVLLGLGLWQLERLAWKEALIAEIAVKSAAAPISLPDPPGPVAELAFMPVQVSGRYLNDKELTFAARTRRGASGFHLVTPFALEDGRVVFLDRGWMPPEAKDPAARPESLVEGPVALSAVVRPGGWQGPGWLRPENQPEAGLWLWPDLAAMAAATGLPQAETSFYLVARESQGSGRWPLAEGAVPKLRNDHLGYALTWFALAAALAVMLLLARFRSGALAR